jgi:MFS family permease
MSITLFSTSRESRWRTAVAAATAGPEKLFNKNFLVLWQGQAVSQFGNQAFALMMMFWTRQATGSSSQVGLLMMLTSLPGLLLGPFGGAVADRHSRKALIIGCDLARGVCLLGLAALMARHGGSVETVLPALVAVALLEGILSALFFPAIAASLPDLVPREKVASANSLYQFSSRSAVTLGQAAGGVLFGWLGAAALCLIDALSFFFSASCAAFVSIPQPSDRPERASSYFQDTFEGLRFVRRQPGMLLFLLTAAALNFFFMPVFVLLPFYATNVLRSGSGLYGFLMAAFAAGGLLGFAVAGSLRPTGKARQRAVIAALLSNALAFSTLGLARQPWTAVASLVLVGFLTSIVNVLVVTLCQLAAPGAMRGRVMGLVLAMSRAMSPLGMALGGVLGDLTGHDIPPLYLACGLLPFFLLCLVSTRPDFRAFLAGEPKGGGGMV